jgi:hypothetical protein
LNSGFEKMTFGPMKASLSGRQIIASHCLASMVTRAARASK